MEGRHFLKESWVRGATYLYLDPPGVFPGGKSGAQVHHLSGSQNSLSEGPGRGFHGDPLL